MKHRNKGFTLVEIVVSIALGSVVLAILGTMILTSSDFLSGTSDSDLDKRCVDSCVEFVRDQIEYSTDVRIIENKGLDNYPVEGEDNWHCFYIKNHILYRDDSPVFDDSFYNHKQLEILVKDDYKNNMRVDFTYHLNDSDGEKAYGNRDTIVFLNITEKVNNEQGLYVSENVSLDANKSFSEKGNYAIYYKKSLKTNHSSDKPSDNPSSNVITGTVKDQEQLITSINNRGTYKLESRYKYGDYVYHDGTWYIWLANWELWIADQNSFDRYEPGTTYTNTAHYWKKIDSNWDVNSGYQIGDIITYKGKYYKCRKNTAMGQTSIEFNPEVNYSWSEQNIWIEINQFNSSEPNLIETKQDDSLVNKRKQLIIKKLNNIDLNEVETYSNNKSYAIGSIVKIKYGNTSVYDYYIKLFDNLGMPKKKVFNNLTQRYEVAWQRISVDYDINSAYIEDDAVYSSFYQNYMIVTDKAGQRYHYDESGKYVSLDPDNKGNINYYIPLINCYNNATPLNGFYYNYWWQSFN